MLVNKSLVAILPLSPVQKAEALANPIASLISGQFVCQNPEAISSTTSNSNPMVTATAQPTTIIADYELIASDKIALGVGIPSLIIGAIGAYFA
jgi:hypothetical protein